MGHIPAHTKSNWVLDRFLVLGTCRQVKDCIRFLQVCLNETWCLLIFSSGIY